MEFRYTIIWPYDVFTMPSMYSVRCVGIVTVNSYSWLPRSPDHNSHDFGLFVLQQKKSLHNCNLINNMADFDEIQQMPGRSTKDSSHPEKHYAARQRIDMTYREIEHFKDFSPKIQLDELGVKKLASCGIPYFLAKEQKTAYVNWCRKTLSRFNKKS
ncbi:hypothetical protein ILUMI_09738 [Ignelater luminosus]|uniref:Uncharacterized protein n=1 Tax=Ignelater luminosus TaxID=2038154 RepID=A0A8K0D586_IGNLU|nr:hypothetical protein ILUMI_09738 [Ignelater luminosus]